MENCTKALESYRLENFLTPIQTEFLQFFSRLCTCLWDIDIVCKTISLLVDPVTCIGWMKKFSSADAFVFF